jgi:hypothetical protein
MTITTIFFDADGVLFGVQRRRVERIAAFLAAQQVPEARVAEALAEVGAWYAVALQEIGMIRTLNREDAHVEDY